MIRPIHPLIERGAPIAPDHAASRPPGANGSGSGPTRRGGRADFYLVTSFDLDVLDDTRNRGRHFDSGFVGFELNDGLLARNRVAHLDEHPCDVALLDVFSQLGNFEFLHQEFAGFGLSVLMLRVLIAFLTTATSILPS